MKVSCYTMQNTWVSSCTS